MIPSSLILGWQLARSVQFTGQQLALPWIELLLTGQRHKLTAEDKKTLQKAAGYMLNLLQKDSENIKNGEYPIQVLIPESPWRHLSRLGSILVDGYQISKRRTQKKAHDLGPDTETFQEDVPDYLKRNYHFQTGGYLTEGSAELYEHQVEILFSGAADAMRRLLIPLVRAKLGTKDGSGLRFLEVGAGTGRLTRFMKLAFPKARIVCTDVSDPYLKKAQERLHDLAKIDFIRCAAEELPFADSEFDLVYSCFLFHELPAEIRKKVIAESARVCKAKGLLGLVDSIQKEDIPELALALEKFPVDFHEPFYKNYSLNPLEDLIEASAFELVATELGFFSKALLAQKKVLIPT